MATAKDPFWRCWDVRVYFRISGVVLSNTEKYTELMQ